MHPQAASVRMDAAIAVVGYLRRPCRRALRIFLTALLALAAWMILAPPSMATSSPFPATAELAGHALPSQGACALAAFDCDAAFQRRESIAASSHASIAASAGDDLPDTWPTAAIDIDTDGDPDPAPDSSCIADIGLLPGQPPARAGWPALSIVIPNEFIPPRWSTS